MKLNLGSSRQKGIYKAVEWVCVDLYMEGRPDVQASGFMLPFADNTFEEVRSIHVLEHLSRDQWPFMLAEMYRTLKVGGTFYVEVPDFPAQCEQYLRRLAENTTQELTRGEPVSGPVSIHISRTGIWGKSERPGMGHQFGFDRDLLARALYKTGFQEVYRLTAVEDMISSHYRNDDPVLLFKATKVADPLDIVDLKSLSFDELRTHLLI